MTAFTSKANGNWSAAGQTTWNQVGTPGSGDTVSIAHNVTVDVNTTIGTSPNDITTAAVTWTAARSLTIAAGVTFTILGNLVDAFNLGILAASGAGWQIIFDNSASGGTPLYGPTTSLALQLSGTVGTPGIVTAPAGKLHALMRGRISYGGTTLSYVNISNMGAVTPLLADIASAYNFVLGNVNFDACKKLILDQNSAASTKNITFDSIKFTNSVDSVSVQFKFDGAHTGAGILRIKDVAADKPVEYLSKGFTITRCAWGGGINCNGGFDWAEMRLCMIAHDGSLNTGNGARMGGNTRRCYTAVNQSAGNPHFLSVTAIGANKTYEQNIFESGSPDLVDVGDCMLVNAGATSSGNIIANNNVVLPSGATVASGTLLTMFVNDVAITTFARNTVNVNNTAVGGVSKRGAFAVAEGSSNIAGQVAILKSNVAWGSSSGQGYLGERVSGNVKDIITAAGADKNWTFNTTAGDNQRSYEDRVASNTMWTAGDAVAASVDVNQGSGDPQFVASTRNLAAWVAARGYGSTYADGIAACLADTTRIPDLLDYVFEGFKPQNSSMRTAAHDGGCAGAANYHKASRSLAKITSARTYFSAKYGIAV